jgi:hypothetical protein
VHAVAIKRWPEYFTFHKQLTNSAPDLPVVARRMGERTAGIITGHTQTTLFRLDSRDQWANTINTHGDAVGQMYGPTPRIARVESSLGLNSQEVCNLEFNALSVFRKDIINVPRTSWDTKRYADASGEKIEEVPMVQVLPIAWDGPIAHREGLGWVYLIDWAAASREWKRIVLQ